MRAWGGIGFELMGICLRGKVTRFSLCEIQRLCKAVSVSVADSSSASMSATFIIAGRLLVSIMTVGGREGYNFIAVHANILGSATSV